MTGYNLEAGLKNIECPAFIFHGEYDPTPAEGVVPIHEKIAGSEFRKIPGAGIGYG